MESISSLKKADILDTMTPSNIENYSMAEIKLRLVDMSKIILEQDDLLKKCYTNEHSGNMILHNVENDKLTDSDFREMVKTLDFIKINKSLF